MQGYGVGQESLVLRILARFTDGEIRSGIDESELPVLLKDTRAQLWVDLSPDGDDTTGAQRVLERFQFHALAIDDALRHTHVPKVDDWTDFVYVVAKSAELDSDVRRIYLKELDVFVGRRFLVTYHSDLIAGIDRVWNQVIRDPKRLAHGTDNLLYQVLDTLVADIMPIADRLDDWLDEIEEEVFRSPSPSTLDRIFKQKRMAIEMRRCVSGLREVLNRLGRDEFVVIDRRDQIYFRDVYDHLVRLYEVVDSLRDLVNSALDIYLSVTSNRTNEIVKALTVVTVLFMPVSFLAGFFGMNFFGEPFALAAIGSADWYFWGSLGMMVLLPVSIYTWMRRRRWL